MGNVALGVTMPGAMFRVDVQSISGGTITTLGNHGLRAGDAVAFVGGKGDEGEVQQAGLGIGAKVATTSVALETAASGSVQVALSTAGDYLKVFVGDTVRIGTGGTTETAVVTARANNTIDITRNSGAQAHPSGSKRIEVIKRPLYVLASGLTDSAFTVSYTPGGAASPVITVDPPRMAVVPDIRVRGPNTSTTFHSSASIGTGTTIIPVDDATKLPAAPFVAIIQGPSNAAPTERWERVLVKAKDTVSSPNTLTVVRAFEGTEATAHVTTRTGEPRTAVFARSLAHSAHAMANLDWRESTIRAACSPSKATNDQHNGRSFGNTLRSVTGSNGSSTLTTGSAHGMVEGDRFVFVTKTGGSNVRLGHTYYVTGISGGSDRIQFCEERLHPTGKPYPSAQEIIDHGAVLPTADVVLASAITAGYIRVLTTGGGATRTLGVANSLYPRIWGWMFNCAAMFDDTPLSAVLHFDAVTDRAAQSLIHLTTMANTWTAAEDKHQIQDMKFSSGVNGGSFKLAIGVRGGADEKITGSISWSSTEATRMANIREALKDSDFGLTQVRIHKVKDRKYSVTFGGSRTELRVHSESLAGGDVKLGSSTMLIRPSRISQFASRLASLGAQIAAASGSTPILVRPNYEFDNPVIWWQSVPSSNGPKRQQMLAWDAMDTGVGVMTAAKGRSLWKQQWKAIYTAVRTTGGAGSRAKFIWCALLFEKDDKVVKEAGSYPNDGTWAQFTGFDLYNDNNVTQAQTNRKLTAQVAAASTGITGSGNPQDVIICEFGMPGAATPSAFSGDVLTGGIPDPDNDDVAQAALHVGAATLGEPSDVASTAIARAAWFRGYMQRLYSNHPRVKAAVYYDLDFSWMYDNAKKNYSLDASHSLVAAFAEEICKAKTRTLVS